MKRPLAYVTAAWRGDECEITEQAAKYCRIVYDAGYSPICPMLFLPLFLNDAVPEEHKNGIDMGRDLLRRSRVLVVCGNYVNEAVKNDIAVAQRLGITATTLEGILTVKGMAAAMRRCAAPLTACTRLCWKIPGDGGYITAEPIPNGERLPLDKVSRSGGGYLSSSFFFSGFASSGGCFSFHSSSKAKICAFILAGVTSLPKYLLSSSVLMITLSTSLFSSLKIPSITSPLSKPS